MCSPNIIHRLHEINQFFCSAVGMVDFLQTLSWLRTMQRSGCDPHLDLCWISLTSCLVEFLPELLNCFWLSVEMTIHLYIVAFSNYVYKYLFRRTYNIVYKYNKNTHFNWLLAFLIIFKYEVNFTMANYSSSACKI